MSRARRKPRNLPFPGPLLAAVPVVAGVAAAAALGLGSSGDGTPAARSGSERPQLALVEPAGSGTALEPDAGVGSPVDGTTTPTRAPQPTTAERDVAGTPAALPAPSSTGTASATAERGRGRTGHPTHPAHPTKRGS